MKEQTQVICLFNPIEELTQSPRTLRFNRALLEIPYLSLISIGLGDSISNISHHLDLTDNPTRAKSNLRLIRKLRICCFIFFSILRLYRISNMFFSPNLRMKSNFLLRRSIRNFLRQHNPDLIIARDIYSIPFLRGIIAKERIWIDLPDFTAEVNSYKKIYQSLFGPYFEQLTRQLPSIASSFSTVSSSLGRHFNSLYDVDARVIRNTVPYHLKNQLITQESIQEVSLKNSNFLRLVYFGAAVRSKEIELCIEAIKLLPEEFSLDLFLVPTDPSYLNELTSKFSNLQAINFKQPVPQVDLIKTISSYTAALIVIPATSINSRCALPNKFFQAIQARLPIITGPSPEIASIVRTYDLGHVSSSFAPRNIAEACQKLNLNRLEKIKKNLDIAALEISDEFECSQIAQRATEILRKISLPREMNNRPSEVTKLE